MSEGETDLVEIMREALRRAKLYTSGLTSETFLDSQMTIDAVALNLLVIGECANRLPADRKVTGTLPWVKMIALRHRIAHGYSSVDPEILWAIIENDFPELARELDALERR